MPDIALKKIPTGLHKRLKRRASLNHRSLNSEVIAILEQALSVTPLNVDHFLDEARALRQKFLGEISEAELQKAKLAGRH